MILAILFIFTISILPLNAQTTESDETEHSLHLIKFTDKSGSPFSIYRPQDFLTAKALERREIQGIMIDDYDLPVNPDYKEKIMEEGVLIQGQSKWLNALSIHCESKKILDKIRLLPFVKSVCPLGKFRKIKKGKMYSRRPEIDSSKHQKSYYGLAKNQIEMLGGIHLHQMGFTGRGVHLAIVDGGFNNAYRMSVFDSLYLENRLLGTHDFVDGDDYVYQSSTHGTSVLSTMASKRPNLIVGTAPDAFYYLFKTEDVRGEYKAEEFNWITAMEYADSIGVDVVNSSMGYNHFRDTSMSYSYKDMDGKTAMITRGANFAVSRGLLIVNAAGNDGHKKWHYLFAPADAAGIFTVAAVDENKKRTNFSSWGPTADGRIKPDIAAQGGKTAYATMTKYDVGYGDGTSYACPVMTGMVASLKQAFPMKSNIEILNAIRQSGHQSIKPDSSLGYGIPDFLKAWFTLKESYIYISKEGVLNKKLNIKNQDIEIFITTEVTDSLMIKIFNTKGEQVAEQSTTLEVGIINKIILQKSEKFLNSCNIIQLIKGKQKYWITLIR